MQLFRCTSHRLAIFLPCREGIAVDSADFWVGIAAVTYCNLHDLVEKRPSWSAWGAGDWRLWPL